MKRPHTTAALLRDLKAHVKSVNPGSEPFASGLKSIGDTAWELLNLRGIEWSVLGSTREYAYTVHCYVASADGVEETYTTPERLPKPHISTPYEQSVRKLAD